MLEVGQKIEVLCHEVDALGNGVAKHETFVVFVKGLLTYEKAVITITKIKKRFAEGKIEKLIEKSPNRKSVLSKLGALDLYHLKDDAQNDWQVQVTKDAFLRQLNYGKALSPIISHHQTANYRNKVVYHVLDSELLRLGMYQTDPIELTEVHTFMLNSHAIQRCVSKIQQHSFKIDPSILKHIMFRSNEKEEILVTLVATKETFSGLNDLVTHMKVFPEVIGITLNIKEHGKSILGKKSIVLHGKNEIHMTLPHLRLTINDRSFFQVNTQIMIKVYKRILEEVKYMDVIDAYCGVGAIGLYLAKDIKQLTLIDNNPQNIVMAQKNTRQNQIHASILKGNVEHVLTTQKADVLIVDPPRAGLDAKLVDRIMKAPFETIVYLSCYLTTLTRDLKKMTEVYEIDSVTPIRMFPQTTSIETLVVLQRKK